MVTGSPAEAAGPSAVFTGVGAGASVGGVALGKVNFGWATLGNAADLLKSRDNGFTSCTCVGADGVILPGAINGLGIFGIWGCSVNTRNDGKVTFGASRSGAESDCTSVWVVSARRLTSGGTKTRAAGRGADSGTGAV